MLTLGYATVGCVPFYSAALMAVKPLCCRSIDRCTCMLYFQEVPRIRGCKDYKGGQMPYMWSYCFFLRNLTRYYPVDAKVIHLDGYKRIWYGTQYPEGLYDFWIKHLKEVVLWLEEEKEKMTIRARSPSLFPPQKREG